MDSVYFVSDTPGKNNGTHGEITIEPVKGGEKQTLKADHILIFTLEESSECVSNVTESSRPRHAILYA